MFLGGHIGTGRQMVSWISTEDAARAIAFLLHHRDVTGPVNLTSPGAVSNRELAKALGRALGKPSLVPTPAWVIRAAMGKMGEELIVERDSMSIQRRSSMPASAWPTRLWKAIYPRCSDIDVAATALSRGWNPSRIREDNGTARDAGSSRKRDRICERLTEFACRPEALFRLFPDHALPLPQSHKKVIGMKRSNVVRCVQACAVSGVF